MTSYFLFTTFTSVAYLEIFFKHHLSSVSQDPFFKTYKTLHECLFRVCRNFTFSRLSPQMSNKCGICIYIFKNPFRQDIFEQTYQNVVFRDYILTLALYEYFASLKIHVIKLIII